MNITPAVQARILTAILKQKPGLTERWDSALLKLSGFESVAEVIGLSTADMTLVKVLEKGLTFANNSQGAPRSLNSVANLAAKPQGRMVVKAGLQLVSRVIPTFEDLLTDTLQSAIQAGVLPPAEDDQSVDDYLLDNVLAKYATPELGTEGSICRCPHCKNLFHIS